MFVTTENTNTIITSTGCEQENNFINHISQSQSDLLHNSAAMNLSTNNNNNDPKPTTNDPISGTIVSKSSPEDLRLPVLPTTSSVIPIHSLPISSSNSITSLSIASHSPSPISIQNVNKSNFIVSQHSNSIPVTHQTPSSSQSFNVISSSQQSLSSSTADTTPSILQQHLEQIRAQFNSSNSSSKSYPGSSTSSSSSPVPLGNIIRDLPSNSSITKTNSSQQSSPLLIIQQKNQIPEQNEQPLSLVQHQHSQHSQQNHVYTTQQHLQIHQQLQTQQILLQQQLQQSQQLQQNIQQTQQLMSAQQAPSHHHHMQNHIQNHIPSYSMQTPYPHSSLDSPVPQARGSDSGCEVLPGSYTPNQSPLLPRFVK